MKKRSLPRKKAFRIIRTFAILALSVAASMAMGAKRPEPPGPHENYGARAETVIRDIPYSPGNESDMDLMLDVYSNPHQGLWPAIVMIHGGSWMEGDKEVDNKVYICKVLAANGYVVFIINYRLWPEVKMKTEAEDAMAAVIWVKRHAREYGADPDRVGVVGGSAGGHLAALVAWASDDPWFEPTGWDDSEVDSDVKVAALYYPVLDVNKTFNEVVTPIVTPLARSLLIGKKPKKQLMHLSPKYHVDANVPPTMFLTGDKDSLKLYPHSVLYRDKLEQLGVDTKLYTAPGKDHGFTWNYWEPESLESVMEIVDFFDKYLK